MAQNLISALNDLQAAQNNFMSVVLNHYENRMLLYRELGIMELDDCGMWIDKPINEADWLTEEECPMPPVVPSEWMQDAGVDLRAMHEGPTEELDDPADREAEVMAEQTAGQIAAERPWPCGSGWPWRWGKAIRPRRHARMRSRRKQFGRTGGAGVVQGSRVG